MCIISYVSNGFRIYQYVFRRIGKQPFIYFFIIKTLTFSYFSIGHQNNKTKNISQKVTLLDAIDFFTASDSELSDLLDNESDENHILGIQMDTNDSGDLSSDSEEDDISLANIAQSYNAPSTSTPGNPAKQTYHWREVDPAAYNNNFQGVLSNPPNEAPTPLHYFYEFFNDETLKIVVDYTNIYSVQMSGFSINTNKEEITTFIRTHIMVGIIQLPNYRAYWSKNARISQIADRIPVNRFEKPRQYFHFVDDNLGNTENEKLFKVKPILDAVRAEYLEIEPGEYHSIDEQIIPCETNRSKILPYNPENNPKMGI